MNVFFLATAIEEDRRTPWYKVLGFFLVIFSGWTSTGANVTQQIVCEGKLNFWSLFLIRGLIQMPVSGFVVKWTKASFLGPKETR